jgi:hypothetical protein
VSVRRASRTSRRRGPRGGPLADGEAFGEPKRVRSGSRVRAGARGWSDPSCWAARAGSDCRVHDTCRRYLGVGLRTAPPMTEPSAPEARRARRHALLPPPNPSSATTDYPTRSLPGSSMTSRFPSDSTPPGKNSASRERDLTAPLNRAGPTPDLDEAHSGGLPPPWLHGDFTAV